MTVVQFPEDIKESLKVTLWNCPTWMLSASACLFFLKGAIPTEAI